MNNPTIDYESTRNANLKMNFLAAIEQGLAPDGGLLIPKVFPNVNIEDFVDSKHYAEFAEKFLLHILQGTPIEKHLNALCNHAFNFPVPCKAISKHTHLLELFHGPTLSFKDFGARFLAGCLNETPHKTPKTIMVATSGDTGSAVASAFSQQSHVRAMILFPENKISKRQQQQITCWGKNSLAIAIKGTFDDCQALVKAAFSDAKFKDFNLTTANSINVGRLLPQTVYYAYTAIHFVKKAKGLMNVIVPSGNLGNVTAAFWAKAMGVPLGKIIIACNANEAVLDYLKTGYFTPRKSIETLANAMDVGNPSNFERLQALFKTHEAFEQATQVFSVNDEQIKATIKDYYTRFKEIICPHTATAAFVREKLNDEPWVIVATAHPAKFETILEPLLNRKIPVPVQLETMLKEKSHLETCAADLSALHDCATRYFGE